jgi:signal transduction histidine kinase
MTGAGEPMRDRPPSSSAGHGLTIGEASGRLAPEGNVSPTSSGQDRASERETEPGREGLWLGILAYRWASYVWMLVQAIVARNDFRAPTVAWTALAVTGVWVIVFTVTRGWRRPLDRWLDLGIAIALIPISALVMEEGDVIGDAPFFATSYPASAAMTMGAAYGLAGGLGSGFALTFALLASRPLNGVPLADLTAPQWAAVGNGAFYYLSAGGAVGLIDRVLTRSGAERRLAVEEAVRERELAARLAERESLGRRIHDSVLQALTLISKRGSELAARPTIPAEEVRALVELAGEQERALRGLIQSSPVAPPAGTVSIRTVLGNAASGVRGVRVSITAVEPIWLGSAEGAELSAAIRQALDNVVDHAGATRVSLFAEQEGADTLVTVRDDGVGFAYDEERLRREGKLGVLSSMKGRVEDLGGSFRIDTAPGRGTEVEFRLPTSPPSNGRRAPARRSASRNEP